MYHSWSTLGSHEITTGEDSLNTSQGPRRVPLSPTSTRSPSATLRVLVLHLLLRLSEPWGILKELAFPEVVCHITGRASPTCDCTVLLGPYQHTGESWTCTIKKEMVRSQRPASRQSLLSGVNGLLFKMASASITNVSRVSLFTHCSPAMVRALFID